MKKSNMLSQFVNEAYENKIFLLNQEKQKLVDIMFQIALTIHDKRYKKDFDKMDNERVAEWVAEQLKNCGFETFQCGSSWGVLKK